jgi:hypothetical protein
MKKYLTTKNILIAIAFLAVAYFLFFYEKEDDSDTLLIVEEEQGSSVSTPNFSPSTGRNDSSDVLVDEGNGSNGAFTADTGVVSTGRLVGRSYPSRSLRRAY